MRKSRRVILLLFPLLIAFVFQATQYARAPIQYGYYIVYAQNAEISLLPGTDRSPTDGKSLLRNSTTQPGLYNLSLGKWAPGYMVNYSDAFHIKNREAFNIRLTGVNFSSDSFPWWNGSEYLAIYLKNDSDIDGSPDGDWVAIWLGSHTWSPATGNQLNASYNIFFTSDAELPCKVMIKIPEFGMSLDRDQASILYSGTIYFWFTSGSD